MKDIWKIRTHNWNKTASILENFGFVLHHTNLAEEKNYTPENIFKGKISKLTKILNPQDGDIVTIETSMPKIIKYAGIYTGKNKILNEQYGETKTSTPEELIKEYSTFHKDIFDNDKIEINYYRTQENFK